MDAADVNWRSSPAVARMLLAYLMHTVVDTAYQALRQKLTVRKMFFGHLRALTCYLCFDDWEHLLQFMEQGLEHRHAVPSVPG